ncbi:hypothetical protein CBM2633_P10014 [Cupriavidus taiwanensis]|uniref:Uncharacterized protein n=2 Tax=Cupriavidus TaxID=106589 RepID=A0A375CPP7_9BURK|nr:hypothetical protein CBM2592_P10014 [Cupriavidus taiwanensis]SOZ40362.1 hypothetical protein CBM2605_P10015 [Cupriavidus neocaledonicus]SOY73991.1 hypothetical protein CBM2588_P10014 [Cupriavidus taiwanensis]SOY74269.1 hypothetical protein CBM2585_P10014 [Cupriavidus taiwanensis]SOY75218.1 hypothetical protein CBM2589_P10014 [Cupriavidus taiwanensis]
MIVLCLGKDRREKVTEQGAFICGNVESAAIERNGEFSGNVVHANLI